MGYEFDDNGKYIGWSDLFDYSSIKELKASEYLPIPNGVTYRLAANLEVQISNLTKKLEEVKRNESLKAEDKEIRLKNIQSQIDELQKYTPFNISGKTTVIGTLLKKQSEQENLIKEVRANLQHAEINKDVEAKNALQAQLSTLEEKLHSIKAMKIRAYASLLKDIEDLSTVSIKGEKTMYLTFDETVSLEVATKVLEDLNLHSKTEISPQKLQACLKNSVSSSITNIIQSLRNMDQAYSPIEMDKVRKAATLSPKGSKADRMTLVNPLTKLLMQEQNMVGKGVIGITAVGEKVFFNVSHYFNEGIRSGDENWIKNLQFSQEFSRIEGRSKDPKGLKSLSTVSKTTIANVNWEGTLTMVERFSRLQDLIPKLREKWGITEEDLVNHTGNWQQYKDELIYQDSSVYADDIISQLLSAATDNAKELILSKINAGTNLAKCYLHLIMMGFNISDIASFMTNDAVSLVNDLSTANMWDEYTSNIKITDAINILEGKFPVYKFIQGIDKGGSSNQDIALGRLRSLQSKLQDLGETMPNYNGKKDENGNYPTVPKRYNNLQSIVKDYYKYRLSGHIKQPLLDFVTGVEAKTRINHNIRALSDYIDFVVSKVENITTDLVDFEADLNEFQKIHTLSNETSTLGSTLLGLNQGLPTSKEDLLAKVINIEKAMSDREAMFGLDNKRVLEDPKSMETLIEKIQSNNPFLSTDDILSALDNAVALNIPNNFNFNKWLFNENGYRRATADYYNLIKGTWNIFDIIDKLPHFNAIFEAFKTVLVTDESRIKKSKILNLIVSDIYSSTHFMDSRSIKNLLDYVDDLFILRWLNNKNFKFPIFDGNPYFQFNWKELIHHGDPNLLSIDSESARGSFKKLFEEVLFPNLQEGFYYDIDESGNKIRIDIGKNKFIQNLVFDINKDNQSYLKLDLDMQNTSSTSANEARYQECLSDFIKLKNFKLGPEQDQFKGNRLSIADWFMVYNLIVNKNKFGTDRLTSLFGQFLDVIKEDSIIKSIMSEVGEFDFSEVGVPETIEDLIEQYGYNRDDALFKIAPIITRAKEAVEQSILVREFNENGIPIVKRKGSNGYSEAEYIIPNSTDLIIDEREKLEDTLIRQYNYIRYGVIKTPFANKRSSTITNLESEDEKLILSALQNLSKLGVLEIYTENC